jgi:hypothetical protein
MSLTTHYLEIDEIVTSFQYNSCRKIYNLDGHECNNVFAESSIFCKK